MWPYAPWSQAKRFGFTVNSASHTRKLSSAAGCVVPTWRPYVVASTECQRGGSHCPGHTHPPPNKPTPPGRQLRPEISTAPLERAWDQEYSPFSLVDGMTDRRLWKHYLPATSLALDRFRLSPDPYPCRHNSWIHLVNATLIATKIYKCRWYNFVKSQFGPVQWNWSYFGKKIPQSTGFEPVRAEPNRFLVCRLNHSATTAQLFHRVKIPYIMPIMHCTTSNSRHHRKNCNWLTKTDEQHWQRCK